ncbi:MAG: hypothetical protein HY051_02290 [Candidatus Aenigmarchaeota archaeon]|nr:hypothetical protein [Candidatus Aenigmarchaeota archaeon]
MDFTLNKESLFLFTTISLLLAMPLVAAQASTGDVGKSLLKLIGIPDEIANSGPQTLIFFIILPSILMFIIMYGILDEIKLFRSGGINFAIAFLSTLLTIPLGLLGQLIVGIYAGGMTALAIIVGLSLLPRFIEVFGPRTGIPPAVLELLGAAVYGLAMYFIFGFLVEGTKLPSGSAIKGVLSGQSWLRWVFTIGVPILVLFRGFVQRQAGGLGVGRYDLRKEEEEIRTIEQSATVCRRALEDLARVTQPAAPGRLPAVPAAAYNDIVARTVAACGGAYPETLLRSTTGNGLKEMSRRHRV